eukprot:TRINITY_DN20178_c0_g1_i2.p1 TRINITY_DN20178_c0_g1~~TRINITY_DN20178_c0_g1_i2.p1  ORF type:complete len:176 (-),score=11.24 TRINITY_DN20178_c0_g1_i2:372-899(-)
MGNIILGKRWDLYELHDRDWFPSFLREFLLEIIAATWRVGLVESTNSLVVPIILNGLQSTQSDKVCYQVTDLCSGSGGPWLYGLYDDVKRAGSKGLQVSLSDYYPNLGLCELYSKGSLRYCKESIDATNTPPEFNTNFFTLFSSMHHFNPILMLLIITKGLLSLRPREDLSIPSF